MKLLFCSVVGVLSAFAADDSMGGCDTATDIQARERVKFCSTFDDEKTFCGMAARSMRLGGQRFTVPCIYDTDTHHCREDYSCNVVDSAKASKAEAILRGDKAPKDKKKPKKEKGECLEKDADEVMNKRIAHVESCFQQDEREDCNSGYSSRMMGGSDFLVPCQWNGEMCAEDMSCAVAVTHETVVAFRRMANETTYSPTMGPSGTPTLTPSYVPTLSPSQLPSLSPSLTPTLTPSHTPTHPPTPLPTKPPTKTPTEIPTKKPTAPPTSMPTKPPTKDPTRMPTPAPSMPPTEQPTIKTERPSMRPTRLPSMPPTPTCKSYQWSRDLDNMSGYTTRQGKFVKDGTCCHPDCPICSDNRSVCSGQVNPFTGATLPDELCCRNMIMRDDDNNCLLTGEAPCFFEDSNKPDCEKVKTRKKCRARAGCTWSANSCFADFGFEQDFQEQCPCSEQDVCTPTTLAFAALAVFDEDTYTTMVEYEQEFNEKYQDADPEDDKVPGYQLQLLLDGVITTWDILVWYQTAGCNSGIFSDVTTPPVHVCLTKPMKSFHVLFEARHEGFQAGLGKKKIQSMKTPNFLECFERMVSGQDRARELELVTWEIDTDNRSDNRCSGYKSTETTFGRPKGTRRAVSYAIEKKWGCPAFKENKGCGKEDFAGYLMNLRVDDVGVTDSKCMCQLMCEDRDVNKQYLSWTWNAYEGKCICAYSAKKNKRTQRYIGTPRWNNISGMMNGNTFEIQTI